VHPQPQLSQISKSAFPGLGKLVFHDDRLLSSLVVRPFRCHCFLSDAVVIYCVARENCTGDASTSCPLLHTRACTLDASGYPELQHILVFIALSRLKQGLVGGLKGAMICLVKPQRGPILRCGLVSLPLLFPATLPEQCPFEVGYISSSRV
jgi:hypothetical protein